jgi:uncharacterized protein YciI
VPATALLLLISALLAQAASPVTRTYQLVLLRKGPNYGADPDQARAAAIQNAHQAYLETLSRQRINLLYGPFLDSGEPRGLLVLDAGSEAEARALMADDPHVKAGNLVVEVKPWRTDAVFETPAHYDVTKPGALDRFSVGVVERTVGRRGRGRSWYDGVRRSYLAAIERRGRVFVAGDFSEDDEWATLVIYRESSAGHAAPAPGTEGQPESSVAVTVRPWATLAGVLR